MDPRMSDHTDEPSNEAHVTRSTDQDTPDDSTAAANAAMVAAENESGSGDAEPAYHAIAFPEEPPNGEWTTDQRRAYVLEELERVGHPFAIDHRALADRFEVAPETIHADVGHLAVRLEAEEITLPDIAPLLTELEAYEATRTEAGSVRYGASDTFHDDCVDALALAARHDPETVPHRRVAETVFEVGPVLGTIKS